MIEIQPVPHWAWGAGLPDAVRDGLVSLADATNEAALLVTPALVATKRAMMLNGAAGEDRSTGAISHAMHRFTDDWAYATLTYQDAIIVVYLRAATWFATNAAALAQEVQAGHLAGTSLDWQAIPPSMVMTNLKQLLPHVQADVTRVRTRHNDTATLMELNDTLAASHRASIDTLKKIAGLRSIYPPGVFDDFKHHKVGKGEPEDDCLPAAVSLHEYAASCLTLIADLTVDHEPTA